VVTIVSKEENKTKLSPERIIQDLWVGRGVQALVAAVELDLFTHIANGNGTAGEISRAAKASERGVKRLLDALVGFGYLIKKGDKYKLSAISEKFLVRGRESYMGEFVYETKLTWENWSRLTDVVRSGRPVDAVDMEERGREFFPRLVAAIFPMSFNAARYAVATLPKKTNNRIKGILDVAAGSGAWSIAFAEAIPGARVTVIDYSEVTPITRKFAERFGVGDKYDYIEGNLREVDFGQNRYDLVILGHIIHSEGEEWGKKLIKKSYRTLKDGGLLLIAEIIPNDKRTGPLVPLVFGLNMLLHTEQGDVFTLSEYRRWLKETGFKKVNTINAPTPSPLILATK
jgi:ubiquinone/menaquinone biosynthesis C-methylase UbiE